MILYVKGIYIWSDGRKYIGEWRSSKMNGVGIYKWKDGREYKGSYKDDKKENFGVYIKSDGKKYEGEWRNGSQNGIGKYVKSEGIVKVGRWKENLIEEEFEVDSKEYKDFVIKIEKMNVSLNEDVERMNEKIRKVFSIYLPNMKVEDFLMGDGS